MNRIAIVLSEHGEVDQVLCDEAMQVLIVDPNAPGDRVYEMSEGCGKITGVDAVTNEIGRDPTGHHLDDTLLGEGYGPRKPPARPTLKPVS